MSLVYKIVCDFDGCGKTEEEKYPGVVRQPHRNFAEWKSINVMTGNPDEPQLHLCPEHAKLIGAKKG
jgi:hypothetical protein